MVIDELRISAVRDLPAVCTRTVVMEQPAHPVFFLALIPDAPLSPAIFRQTADGDQQIYDFY